MYFSFSLLILRLLVQYEKKNGSRVESPLLVFMYVCVGGEEGKQEWGKEKDKRRKRKRKKGKKKKPLSDVQSFNLLLYVFGSLDALSDVRFVRQVRFCAESFVKAGPEVGVS